MLAKKELIEAAVAGDRGADVARVDRLASLDEVRDSARFQETVRRLKVRWAAIPTEQIPELAAHYPERRLPSVLVFDHADAESGIQVFRIVLPGPPTPMGRRS